MNFEFRTYNKCEYIKLLQFVKFWVINSDTLTHTHMYIYIYKKKDFRFEIKDARIYL